jgi:SAM-dependent methyltransferase
MPATTRTVKNLLSRAPAPIRDRAGKALLRGYEAYLSRRGAHEEAPGEHDGLAVPPAKLRVLIAGDSDLDRFLISGERESRIVRDTVARAGTPVNAMDAILDWGCGCGRVTRWWSDLDGVAVTACDYNAELVDWVGANLPFTTALRNRLEPPLPVGDASQDLVYAFSVLTHLPDELALEWMREIRRVLAPGGLFFFTTHGEACRDRVTPEEAKALSRGESVVQFSGIAGTNLCAAYHPRAFVESRLADGFEVVDAVEAHLGGADAETGMVQDRYLLRRTD